MSSTTQTVDTDNTAGYTFSTLFPLIERIAFARMTGAPGALDAAIHVTGQPGTAKTAFFNAVYAAVRGPVAEFHKVSPGDIPWVGLMCPSLDPMDPRGLPVNVTVDGKTFTEWARPGESIMPLQGRPAAFLFMDEPDKAAPAVRNALYQGLYERRFGEHLLPTNTFTSCATNLVSDRAGGSVMESHGQNRMMHFRMGIDIDAVNTYFGSKNYHPAIMGFLKDFPDFAYKFNPKAKQAAYPTLRSWEFFAQALSLVGASTMHIWGPGTVGDEAAAKFGAYFDMVDKIPAWATLRKMTPEDAAQVIKGLPPSCQYAAISIIAANVSDVSDVDWMVDTTSLVTPDYAGMAYAWLTQTYKAKAPLAWKSTKARRFHVDVGMKLHDTRG